MDSCPTYGSNHHRPNNMVDQVDKMENYSSPPLLFRQPPSHRCKCQSLSSLSTSLSRNNITTSSFSCFDNNYHQDYLMSQNTSPIASSPALSSPSRIPFSWEKLPGIPKQKNQDSKKKLPLPPAASATTKNNLNYSSRRYSIATSSSEEMMGSFREDPFLIAMVECSKDKHRREKTNEVKPTRSRGGRRSISSIITSHLSDRIGMINMYASCKTSCTVSDVRLPSTTTMCREDLLGRGDRVGGRRL